MTPDENPLYELAKSPDAEASAMERIRAASGETFLRWAEQLLEDRYVDRATYERFTALSSTVDGDLPPGAEGLAKLGRLTAILQARAGRDQPSAEDLRRWNDSIKQQKDLRDAFDAYYMVSALTKDRFNQDRFNLDLLRIHRIGTTSAIFTCELADGSERQVLKCLFPRYAAMRSITQAVEDYQAKWERIPDTGRALVPAVWDFKSRRFINMQLVGGETLAQFSEAERLFLADEEALDLLEHVLTSLCDGLADLAQRGEPHLDLSPYNILVDEARRLWLIDFGRNFLVEDLVTGGVEYDRIVTYISPELQANPRHRSYACDLFSLGMVMLSLASTPTSGASQSPMTRQAINSRLIRLWREAPGFARIVERLISENPSMRLLALDSVPRNYGARYEALRNAVVREIAVIRATGLIPLGSARLAWRRLADYLAGRAPEIEAVQRAADEIDATAKELEDMSTPLATASVAAARDTATYFRRLGTLGTAYLAFWSSVVFPAIVLTILDAVGRENLPGWLDSFVHSFSVAGVDLPANLPGRAISVTTALIALGYYLTIFAMVDTREFRRSPSLLVKLAPISARLMPLGAISLQVVAVLYNPHLWGLFAGIGGFFVSANNGVWFLVARRVRAAHPDDRLGSEVDAFLHIFGAWWWLMGLYSVGVVSVGMLVYTGAARDEWVYAIAISGLNVLKLYLSNIFQEGPRIRSHLSRATSFIRDEMGRVVEVERRLTLRREQLAALNLVYASFRENGRWPRYQYVERALERGGLEPVQVLDSLPRRLVARDFPQTARNLHSSDLVQLSIAGVSVCHDARRDIDLFLEALRLIVDESARFDPDPETRLPLQIGSRDLASRLALSAEESRRVHALLRSEASVVELDRVDGEDWVLDIHPRAHELSGIDTIYDYLDATGIASDEPRPGIALSDSPLLIRAARHPRVRGLVVDVSGGVLASLIVALIAAFR